MTGQGRDDMDEPVEAVAAVTEDWIPVGHVDDFVEGSVALAKLPSGFPVAIYRVGGAFHVTADRCTHGAASLSEEGELDGHVITCAWHYGTFDIRTGAALTLPCRTALLTFDTRLDADQLLVRTKPNRRSRPEDPA